MSLTHIYIELTRILTGGSLGFPNPNLNPNPNPKPNETQIQNLILYILV